jgi:hypothetical protein
MASVKKGLDETFDTLQALRKLPCVIFWSFM